MKSMKLKHAACVRVCACVRCVCVCVCVCVAWCACVCVCACVSFLYCKTWRSPAMHQPVFFPQDFAMNPHGKFFPERSHVFLAFFFLFSDQEHYDGYDDDSWTSVRLPWSRWWPYWLPEPKPDPTTCVVNRTLPWAWWHGGDLAPRPQVPPLSSDRSGHVMLSDMTSVTCSAPLLWSRRPSNCGKDIKKAWFLNDMLYLIILFLASLVVLSPM